MISILRKHIVKFAFLMSVLVLAVGFASALVADDSHLFQRFGALLTSLSAFGIMLQLVLENKIHCSKEAYKARISEVGTTRKPSTNIDDVAKTISLNAAAVELTKLESERFRVVASFAASAGVGELIHGFGDLLFLFLTQ